MNGVNLHVPNYGPQRRTKKIILCFDGTGNKFSGTVADSNILKIYRMLDRGDPDQLHYYQVCPRRLARARLVLPRQHHD